VFVDQLRQQNRPQRSVDGEEIVWLCPSHPQTWSWRSPLCWKWFATTPWTVSTLTTSDIPTARPATATAVAGALPSTPHRPWPTGPGIQPSAAVFSDWPQTRLSIGQDWVQWLDHGYLDFICPMDFLPNRESFRAMVRRQVEWVGGRMPLYVGIGAFRLPATADLIDQITWTRQAGADGFILFEYGTHLGEKVLPLLRAGITATNTHLAHSGPHVHFTASGDTVRGLEPSSVFYRGGRSVSLSARLIPGVTSGDAEVPVAGPERELVLSLLNWLADTETR
jgi:hypothetical protein